MSDSTTKNKSGDIENIECNYNIASHHYSEPGYQNQNWVENKIRDIKNMVNNIMDITGTPAKCWLICTMYVIALMQLISQPSLKGISAIQKSQDMYKILLNVFTITGGNKFIISTAILHILAKATKIRLLVWLGRQP